jgi:hypothetical protein
MAHTASAQVVFPGLHSEPRVGVFGTFTDVKPDFQYYGDFAVVGATVGAYLETPYLLPHLIGVEARSSLLRWDGEEHEESVLIGPRITTHIARLSPYFSVLGGEANAWRWAVPRHTGQPEPKLVEGTGPQWSLVGGLDVSLPHHLGLRVGELSYSRTYLKNWGLTPLTASAGIVYRLK